MGTINWRKIYAQRKTTSARIHKFMPDFNDNASGIYVFTRTDENNIKYAYIGQAKHLLDRLTSHFVSHAQHIDNSLHNRGLENEGKSGGWHLDIIYCGEEILDAVEKEYIKKAIDRGYQLYNKTIGGQGEGKAGIGENGGGKGYRKGVLYGYEKCRKEMAELFDKYLEAVAQSKPECFKKDGTLKEIYSKKLEEFKNFLKGETDDK